MLLLMRPPMPSLLRGASAKHLPTKPNLVVRTVASALPVAHVVLAAKMATSRLVVVPATDVVAMGLARAVVLARGHILDCPVAAGTADAEFERFPAPC